jgi:hypothetical protein
MKMTFDHFDTQVSHEETQACQDWVDMQCEKAEAESVAGTMAQLDRGPTNFAWAAGYPPTL